MLPAYLQHRIEQLFTRYRVVGDYHFLDLKVAYQIGKLSEISDDRYTAFGLECAALAGLIIDTACDGPDHAIA